MKFPYILVLIGVASGNVVILVPFHGANFWALMEIQRGS